MSDLLVGTRKGLFSIERGALGLRGHRDRVPRRTDHRGAP